jgi:AAR2 protein
LFYRFIPVLYEQLRQLPKDFFSDDLSKVSFINDSLNTFFDLTQDDHVSKSIKLRVAKLKEMLLFEYGFKPKLSLE